jgi:NAD(P)-dependent dehydrogenase (short-subunit alcohol dehydrogenase family)
MVQSQALKDRKVLVTGGTSGIGQAIAIAAAEAGADVAYCGLTDEGSQVTRDCIERAGRRAYFEALDLSDLSSARSFARNAIETLGGVDALINNAGIDYRRGVLRATQSDIDQCLATNFYPAWALCQEVFPSFKATGGGTIINITSLSRRTILSAGAASRRRLLLWWWPY